MRDLRAWLVNAALGLGAATSAVLACGAPPPQQPPPPPPNPPIVCCIVIAKQPDPADPQNFECWIVRYFRQDGQPLYQSNPMPLPATQACVCAVPPLPPAAIGAGAQVMGLSFGARPPWQGLPPNVPGYLNFAAIPQATNPALYSQAQQFFSAYQAQTGGTVTPPEGGFAQLWGFTGPTTIQPNLLFDIYQKLRVPRGFPPSLLCIPGQMWMISLFLLSGNTLLAEPIQPGLPPLSIGQFAGNPGQSAFYKFKWYPDIVPPVCPPCPGDTNGDLVVNFADLNRVLGFFGVTCPPLPDADTQ